MGHSEKLKANGREMRGRERVRARACATELVDRISFRMECTHLPTRPNTRDAW